MRLSVIVAAGCVGREPGTVRRWTKLADTLPLPNWLQKTATGEAMPNIEAIVRRQRAQH